MENFDCFTTDQSNQIKISREIMRCQGYFLKIALGTRLAKSPIVTEMFLRGRKLHTSLVFISQSYFKVSKTIKLNATYCFIMKITNK